MAQDFNNERESLLVHSMSSLARRLSSVPGLPVQVVGVSGGDKEQLISKLSAIQRPISFTVIADTDGSLHSTYSRLLEFKGTSLSFVINEHGLIEWSGHPTHIEVSYLRSGNLERAMNSVR